MHFSCFALTLHPINAGSSNYAESTALCSSSLIIATLHFSPLEVSDIGRYYVHLKRVYIQAKPTRAMAAA